MPKIDEGLLLTKKELREALIKANCPPSLIDKIGQDISLWWKTGWFQEFLYAQLAAATPSIEKRERERILALYENMGCVPEEDNCWYRFWQALKEEG